MSLDSLSEMPFEGRLLVALVVTIAVVLCVAALRLALRWLVDLEEAEQQVRNEKRAAKDDPFPWWNDNDSYPPYGM